ncbi:MAG: hypothetical protein HYS27_22765 [Deltaproteobacteria bacterium]|nr:hypothetical protein [Deltaproteobacteria bacterium]
MESLTKPAGELAKPRRESWATKVVQLLGESVSRESLRLAALELGTAARIETDPEVFRTLETELARLPLGSDKVLQAYALALTDLVSSLVRRVEAEIEDGQTRQLALRRLNYLACLKESWQTPSQIAETINKDLAQVSKELGGLRDAGLVEVFHLGDKRERPHRLTLRGRRALADVAAEATPTESAPAVAPVVEIARPAQALPARVFRRSLVLSATVRIDIQIKAVLTELWLESAPPEFLRELTRRAPPEHTSLVVRSQAVSAWQHLFLASSANHRWRECSYVPAAMANPLFAHVPDEKYVVLYDDPEQAKVDRGNEFGQRLLGNAEGACLVRPSAVSKELSLEWLS